MQRNITLEEYVAENNTKAAKKLIRASGFDPARSLNDAVKKLSALVEDDGKDALRKLAMIHPDKDLIIWAHKEELEKEITAKANEIAEENKSNACGCSGADGSSCAERDLKASRFDALEYLDANGMSVVKKGEVRHDHDMKEQSKTDWLPLLAMT